MHRLVDGVCSSIRGISVILCEAMIREPSVCNVSLTKRSSLERGCTRVERHRQSSIRSRHRRHGADRVDDCMDRRCDERRCCATSQEPDATHMEPEFARSSRKLHALRRYVVKVSGQVLRMPPSVQTVLPEAAKALEQAWQRRRQELAGWQPAGGWLLDQRLMARRTNTATR